MLVIDAPAFAFTSRSDAATQLRAAAGKAGLKLWSLP
jgi:hypothetical protein